MQTTQTAYKDLILQSGGYFGPYGGCFVPEVLLPGLQEIAAAFDQLKFDAAFLAEFHDALHTFSGRPTAFTRSR